MDTATIDLDVLHAVSLFVSNEETRYYLNGVLLEIDAVSVNYVATDSHRLMAYRKMQFDPPNNTLLGSFIVPTVNCKPFKRKRGAAPEAVLSSEEGGRLRFQYGDDAQTFRPVDGSFPNWRIVASGTTRAPADALLFDWKHLTDFQKVSDLLGMAQPILLPGGMGAAVVSFGPKDERCFGLVMPKRVPEMAAEVMPAWLKAATPAPGHEDHGTDHASHGGEGGGR